MHSPQRNLAPLAMTKPPMELLAHVRVVESIRQVGAEAWNSCFVRELEAYHYLLAVEESAIAGFAWRYVLIEKHGQLLAAMPAFLTDYRLDTTLEKGALRRGIERMRALLPRFLTMKLACLGSPATESGVVGFHTSVSEAQKPELLAQLIEGFEHYAVAQGYKLLGIKDIGAQHKGLWHQAAPCYTAIDGLATAHLDINFASVDEYLERLSKDTRKDMRRKLKAAHHIRVEERTNIDDVLPRVLQLYRETKARSEFEFEELTEAYFRGVLAHMNGGAFCTLYWQGEQLLAANLMLRDEHKLLDKFFCMDGAEGRKHNIYFLSWFYNLRYCIEHRIAHYQSGQACYANKLRLKSYLNPNAMLFRHANPVIGGVLRLIAPLLAMES